MTTEFDVFIIGAGQAGPTLAHDLAKAGRKVGVAERKHLGGSCVNFGCTPTKAVVASARVAHVARRASEYGIGVGAVTVHFKAVLERARRIVAESVEHLQKGFTGDDAPTLLRGHARLAGRDGETFRIEIDGKVVRAKTVVLNTGTRSLVPSIEGLDAIDFIDADHWLDQKHEQLPSDLLIVGGGYVGLEMAQFYRRMGSRVTVVESSKQIMGHEDEDVARAMREMLEAEDIRFVLERRAVRFARTGQGVRTTLEGKESNGGNETLDSSHVFIALGRNPNTDDLGLDMVGVKVNDKGIVQVDERLATSTEGIWVAGDIRGGPMFTHTSWDDYRVLRSQLLGDGTRTTAGRIVPYAVFTDPELGRVGMTESEARKAGKKVKIGHFEMKSNGKARELGETRGFVKVVVDAGSERILGAAVFALEGAELVHLFVDLMNADAPFGVMRDAIHIHPTLAEGLQSAVADL
ncbi:MAG: mercuric reductase [Casimicrobiaceae bacterium]